MVNKTDESSNCVGYNRFFFDFYVHVSEIKRAIINTFLVSQQNVRP